MSLNNLYILADNINSLRNYEKARESTKIFNKVDYQHIVFKTYFCGEPMTYANVNLPVVVTETYPNPLYGHALYGCNFTIKCRILHGIMDLDNRQVYEGENEELFVYRYTPSTPSNPIDEGIFSFPRLEFEHAKDMYAVFNKISEHLIDKTPLHDELVKLTLANRITELQSQAYMQGKGNLLLMQNTNVTEES